MISRWWLFERCHCMSIRYTLILLNKTRCSNENLIVNSYSYHFILLLNASFPYKVLVAATEGGWSRGRRPSWVRVGPRSVQGVPPTSSNWIIIWISIYNTFSESRNHFLYCIILFNHTSIWRVQYLHWSICKLWVAS